MKKLMECVCGYSITDEEFKSGKERFHFEGFISMNKKQMYSCPKCGTLKVFDLTEILEQ